MKTKRLLPALIALACALLFGCAAAAHMPPLVEIGGSPTPFDVFPRESETSEKAHVNTEISGTFEQYQPSEDNPFGPALEVLVWTLLAIAGLFLLVLLIRVGLRAWRSKRALAKETDIDETPLEVEPSAVAPSLEDAATALEQHLDGDKPIVAAWLAIEARLTAEGHGRHSYETSSEFVQRVVGSVGLDDSHLARLAELYRAERYSSGGTSTTELDEAKGLLRLLSGELEASHRGGAPS